MIVCSVDLRWYSFCLLMFCLVRTNQFVPTQQIVLNNSPRSLGICSVIVAEVQQHHMILECPSPFITNYHYDSKVINIYIIIVQSFI